MSENPSNLGPPSNLRLQGAPFQPLNISVQKVGTPRPSYIQPLYMTIPPFYIFPNPTLLARLSRQYRPNETQDKSKNELMRESYFFIFRRLKNNTKCFVQSTLF